MGITIHYSGKAKSLEAVDKLLDTFTYFAEQQSWEHWLVDEKLKGAFHPSWGYGYGYISKREDMQKGDIEFFPKMVSKDCNGYFRLFDTKYTGEVRRSLRKGKNPAFFIDTTRKGICLNIHPRCETLEFSFDLKTIELANYYTVKGSAGIFGSNGFFCKTQFAGFETHRTVCALIKATELYVDYDEIDDEAKFYGALSDKEAKASFDEMNDKIATFGKMLKEVGKKRGVAVRVGTDQ